MELVENKTFDEIKLGDSASLCRRLTLQDIKLFAALTGNFEPASIDDDYARRSPFHEVIAHGLWGGSLISTVLGTQLPGPGTVFVDLSLHFLKSVTLGQQITVTVTARDKDSASKQITFDCLCVNGNDEKVITGEAVVQAPTIRTRYSKLAIPEVHLQERKHLLLLLRMVSKLKPLRTAVVHPTEIQSLKGAIDAARANLIEPVLVGPEHKIQAVAAELGIDLSAYELIPTEHSHAAAEKGVELARSGAVEALMKGNLHTDELMLAVLDKETGLRTDRRMSHVFAFDVPTYPRPLLITDAALNIYPTLEDKRDIVQNAIDLAIALRIRRPKVAVLSAIETVNPKIQSTLEAAALCKMADRGQIKGGIVDGPLAFDNAVSEEAAHTKGIVSPVAGQADILVVPDVVAGNMLAKQLEYLAGAEGAGVVVGARVPIILTSRADDTTSRMASCAIAVMQAHKMRLRRA